MAPNVHSETVRVYLSLVVLCTAARTVSCLLHTTTESSTMTNTTIRPDFPVRLVGGPSDSEGRVEVFYDNQWGTVCDDEWTNVEASVVCRQLGYNTTVSAAVRNAFYGQGRGPIFLDDVNCFGWESSLSQCSSNDFYDHNCGHSEDAGVVCQYKDYTGRVIGTLVFVGVSSLIIIIIGGVAVARTVRKNPGSNRSSAVTASSTAPAFPYQNLAQSAPAQQSV
ncbi:scavenger receptor cysteine-rich domain-containing protein DMBT1-like [Diadema setosum]|uniref:scavenger receptor cysteine-rich domain-containing protein DMBT1-like n=1 Tax=Diadema setosum TaxID=31175 RepID=UPI003B3B4BD0